MHRIGRIRLTLLYMCDFPDYQDKLNSIGFNTIKQVKVSYADMMEFTGICPYFEEIPEGEPAPLYLLESIIGKMETSYAE